MNKDLINTKEIEARKKLKEDFDLFARNCLRIRVKEPQKNSLFDDPRIVPFNISDCQRIIHNKVEAQWKDKGFVRAILLKSRQIGGSTYVEGRYFHKTIHEKGILTFIAAHLKDATYEIFEMVQRFYNYLPEYIKPFVDRNNTNELRFSILDSRYKVGVASTEGVGRSKTVNFLHGSEVGHWKDAENIVSGLMQTVPTFQSEIILESTAQGQGNYFHDQWIKAEKGKTDFIPIFISFSMDPYCVRELDERFDPSKEDLEIQKAYSLSNEQLFFRQLKIADIGESLFKQEYPLDSREAFQATTKVGMIKTECVERARKTVCEKFGPLIIGVDPARSENGDRTSIICRQTRCAYGLNSFKTTNTMYVVGLIVKMIQEMNVSAVCIDTVGIGGPMLDRLRELGYGDICFPVVAGSNKTVYEGNKYKNKKAEMWGLMKEWLEDEPCQIPDEPSLHIDLCAPMCDWDSNNLMFIESKESLKKRGFDSPDEAEALAMTFAVKLNTQKSNISVQRVFRL